MIARDGFPAKMNKMISSVSEFRFYYRDLGGERVHGCDQKMFLLDTHRVCLLDVGPHIHKGTKSYLDHHMVLSFFCSSNFCKFPMADLPFYLESSF